MTPFLKRRWFLLSCAIVLLVGTMVDLVRWSHAQEWAYDYGIENGGLLYRWSNPIQLADSAVPETGSGVFFELHRPRLGGFEYVKFAQIYLCLKLPLWCLITAVIGWIAFLELRWREKRASSANG